MHLTMVEWKKDETYLSWRLASEQNLYIHTYMYAYIHKNCANYCVSIITYIRWTPSYIIIHTEQSRTYNMYIYMTVYYVHVHVHVHSMYIEKAMDGVKE